MGRLPKLPFASEIDQLRIRVAVCIASGVLTPRESAIIERRLGMGGFGSPMTHEALAQLYGVKRHRIARIEKKALAKVMA